MGDTNPLSGIGSIISGVAQTAQTIDNIINSALGGHKNVAQDSLVDATTKTSAEQATTEDTETDKATTTAGYDNSWQSVVTNMNERTTGTVANTADAGAISTLRNLAGAAIANSTDPNKTTDLLHGILQTAGDAMTAVFGKQSQSGGYNSAATAVQTGDITSRAAADAARDILSYRTGQQSLASNILNQILGVTGVKTTDQNVATTGRVDTGIGRNTGSTTYEQDFTKDYKDTQAQQTQDTDTTTQAHEKDKTGSSVVCTWMYENKLLSARRYYVVSKDYNKKPLYQKRAYLAVVAPLVRILRASHTSSRSRVILWVFGHRTRVCLLTPTPCQTAPVRDSKDT